MKIFFILLISIFCFSSFGQSPTPSTDPCFTECRKGLESKKCEPCLRKYPDKYVLDPQVFGPAPLPCYNECKKGAEKKRCISCLESHPDLFKLDEEIYGLKSQPCYSQCKKGIENKGCAVCILKNKDMYRFGCDQNELSDCAKHHDGRSISCPDGLYIKSSSVVDSMRMEGKDLNHQSSEKSKKNSSGALEQ